jgi:hypothetical protein
LFTQTPLEKQSELEKVLISQLEERDRVIMDLNAQQYDFIQQV